MPIDKIGGSQPMPQRDLRVKANEPDPTQIDMDVNDVLDALKGVKNNSYIGKGQYDDILNKLNNLIADCAGDADLKKKATALLTAFTDNTETYSNDTVSINNISGVIDGLKGLNPLGPPTS